MKLRNLIFVLGLICGFSAFAFGIKPPPHCDRKPVEEDAEAAGHFPPPPPAGAISGEDARLLKSLFLMSDAELKRLREFIQHLERIAPEQRKMMAEDFERAAGAKTPEQRRAFAKEMRERFRKERANILSRYYAGLSPEQADAERKKFLEMNPRERRAYIREIRRKMGLESMSPK